MADPILNAIFGKGGMADQMGDIVGHLFGEDPRKPEPEPEPAPKADVRVTFIKTEDYDGPVRVPAWHYKQAELLLAGVHQPGENVKLTLAEAQVHATLAGVDSAVALAALSVPDDKQ